MHVETPHGIQRMRVGLRFPERDEREKMVQVFNNAVIYVFGICILIIIFVNVFMPPGELHIEMEQFCQQGKDKYDRLVAKI